MMNDGARPRDLAERTKEYALRIIRLYSALPTGAVAQTIGKQLLRSGTSVGANYREAHRGRSKAEFIAKMGDSLKELDESAYWLELLRDSEAVPVSRLADLQQETDELIAIFVTIIKKAKAE
jgi:four helix bundle protein